MTKDIKSLVKEIQKMASPPPDPPAGYVPSGEKNAPTPTSVVTPSVGGTTVAPVHYGNPVIEKMQQALITLAKEITSQLNLKNLTSGDPRKQSEAGGRDSFADFLTKHFMRNSNVPAVEFSPDATKNKMQNKDPRIASKMSWVMDTMARVGGATNEFKADGVWGPRTAAALDNVYALTSGLFALADAFGVHLRSYDKNHMQQLRAGIENSEEFSLNKKITLASKITKHINSIRNMYQELKNQVLQLPQYQTYIENDTPYIQHEKPNVGFKPTIDQLNMMKKVFSDGFNIYLTTSDSGAKISAQITVDDLASPEAFKEWMRSRGVARDANEVLKQVIDQVGSA